MTKRKKDWIKGAIDKPGALHRELGVPEGEPIPADKLSIKPGDSPKTKRRKNLARTLKKLRK